MTDDDEHDHCGPDCPQCQAQALAAKFLGGFAEAMQKALDDGTYERLGREVAMKREEAVLAAVMGRGEDEAPPLPAGRHLIHQFDGPGEIRFAFFRAGAGPLPVEFSVEFEGRSREAVILTELVGPGCSLKWMAPLDFPIVVAVGQRVGLYADVRMPTTASGWLSETDREPDADAPLYA